MSYLFTVLFLVLANGVGAGNPACAGANSAYADEVTGWDKAWAGKERAAVATVDKSGGRTGGACLKVVHTGPEDWAVSRKARVPATPGRIYEVTAWFKTLDLRGTVEACGSIRDASGEVLEWSAGEARTTTDHGFRKVSARFMAPEGAATVNLRIVGQGPGTVWCDDVSLVEIESPIANKFPDVTLKNRVLSVTIDGTTGALAVSGKGAGREWKQASPGASLVLAELRRVSAAKAVIKARDVLAGMDLGVTVSLHGSLPWLTMEVDGGERSVMPGYFFYPPAFLSAPEDLALLPFAEGLILPVTDPSLKRWFELSDWKSAMGFAGVTDLNRGYIVIADPAHDAGFSLDLVQGLLAVRPFMKPSRGGFGYPRRFTFVFTDHGGVTALAALYRAYAKERNWVATLAARRKANPNIGKLLGAVDLWALDGKLPADFYDDLKASGVDKAIVSLFGDWQAPDEAGGTIRKLNAFGWLTSRYDIYTDVWNRADNPPEWLRTEGYPQDVIVMSDGSLRKGWVNKSEGGPFQGYYICSLTHYPTAKERITADLAANPYNARFIDVVTADNLSECWSKDHPTDRAGDAATRARMLSLVSREFRLVTGSEEIREWAVPYSEFSEGTMSVRPHSNAGYDWSKPVEVEPEYAKFNSSAAYRAPLFELVFHDCHVSTWYTGDGSSKVPDAWEAKDLLNILYGTMPLWMPDAGLWAKYRERFIGSYHNVCTVFGAVAGSAMESWEALSPDREVQRTRFSNGTTVTANFGERECVVDQPERRILPRHGYVASGKDLLAWRAVVDGRTVNVVETPDKVFLDAGGKEHGTGDLSWDGMAVLIKTGAGARLVLLGGGKSRIRIAPGRILNGKMLGRAAVYPLDSNRKRLAPLDVDREGGAVIFTPPLAIMMLEIE